MLKNYFIHILFSIILAFSTNVHIYSTFENQKKPLINLPLDIATGSLGFLIVFSSIVLGPNTYIVTEYGEMQHKPWAIVGYSCLGMAGTSMIINAIINHISETSQLDKWNNRADEEVCNDAFNTCVITERNFSKIQKVAKAYLDDNEISLSSKNAIIASLAKLNQNGLIHLVRSLTHTYKMLNDHEIALKERLNYHDEAILDWHECITRIAKIKNSLYQVHNLIVGSDNYLIELEKENGETEEIKIQNIDFIR